jgi:threonine dehydrogenase-like Zn-dependent dehydrogenase
VVALVKHEFQAEMARRRGADVAVLLGRGDVHYDTIADLTGGVLRRPMLGKRVLIGGVDMTVECVGSSRSLDDALRLTRSGGTVLVLGLASVPRGVDWGPVWLNELNVTGSYIYGVEHWAGRRLRTVEVVLDWMTEGRVDVSPLLTHLYPLEAYPQAFTTAMGKAHTSAFKVAFHFP